MAADQRADAQAVPPALARNVRPTPGTRPLGAVLAELSRQSRLPFSYSSSLVPTGARCHLRPGPTRPLGAVLREVLGANHLTFGLLDGQLVLWPEQRAVPAGVIALNGQSAPPTRSGPHPSNAALAGVPRAAANPIALGPAPRAAAARSLPAQVSAPAAAGRSANRPPTVRAHSAPTKRTDDEAPEMASAAPSRPLASRSELANLPRKQPHSPTRQLAAQPPAGNRALARGLASKSAGGAGFARWAVAVRGRAGQPPVVHAAAGSTSASGAPASRPALRLGAGRASATDADGALIRLPARPVGLALEPLAEAPTRLPNGPTRALEIPIAAARPPRIDLGFLGPFYPHGEVWSSESLPLNTAVKVGAQRAYLLLGASTEPFGRGGGAAWGLGVGTAGAARGRFAPSLDGLFWLLTGDRGNELVHASLLQLRPALAWQLRADGRLRLFGGPTLNLATARFETSPRGSLGEDQWLWVSKVEDHFIVRLWPGVQVGLRF